MVERPPIPRSEREAILIVEDDPDARELLAALLSAHGYRVLRARHGVEALERLAEDADVCLILLDLMLPLMDGQEFRAEQLRRPDIAAIPVVVVSADDELESKAQRLHASAALRKPVELERLLELVRAHCPHGAS